MFGILTLAVEKMVRLVARQPLWHCSDATTLAAGTAWKAVRGRCRQRSDAKIPSAALLDPVPGQQTTPRLGRSS